MAITKTFEFRNQLEESPDVSVDVDGDGVAGSDSVVEQYPREADFSPGADHHEVGKFPEPGTVGRHQHRSNYQQSGRRHEGPFSNGLIRMRRDVPGCGGHQPIPEWITRL